MSYVKPRQGRSSHVKFDKGGKVKLGEDYERVLAGFLGTLVNKREGTKRLYQYGCENFLRFLTEHEGAPEPKDWTSDQAERWMVYLLDEDGGAYSPATVQSVTIAARLLCETFIEEDGDGELKVNPFRPKYLKELPKPIAPDVKYPSAADVQSMCSAAKREKSLWGKRDVAIMLLLYGGGFRRQELADIEDDDVDFTQGRVHIRRGKGGAARTIAPGPVAMLALDRYISARRKYLASLRQHQRALYSVGPIWLSMRGGHLGAEGLAQALKARAEQAEVTAPVNPHSWRHAAATSDAGNGMGDMELRSKYGWSPGSTMPFRYTKSTLAERTMKKSQVIAAGGDIKI